jgi:hypothetical protein
MAESAGPSQTRKPANDAPPAEVTGSRAAALPGTGAGPGTATAAPGTASVGARQVQAKAAAAPTVGAAEDPAERAADETADKVMRMMDPVGAPPEKDVRDAPAAADPGRNPAVPAPLAAADIRRKETAAAADPVTRGAGPRPDVVTPAGPAPLAATPAGAAAGATVGRGGKAGVESGLPAAEPEPPAAAGEQPARGTPEVPKDVQHYLEASRGRGAPLPEDTREEFEAKFGRTLEDVGIHDTAQADNAARRIDALAFTRGSDIYFRSGAFDPTSESGRHLLAHELAHVVQQRPGINRELRRRAGSGAHGGHPAPAVIRRAGASAKGKQAGEKQKTKGTEKSVKLPEGEIDTTRGKQKLHLNELHLPAFKVPHHEKQMTWKGSKRSGKHGQEWAKKAAPLLVTLIQDHAKTAGQKGDLLYFQHGTGKEERLFVGKAEDVAHALSTLPWDQKGMPHKFQIDHQQEIQLGGADLDPTNMWLLDASINMSSGGTIQASIRRDIEAFLALAEPTLVKTPNVAEVEGWAAKGEGQVTFGRAVKDTGAGRKGKTPLAVTATDPPKWSLEDLATARMDPLERMSTENRKKVTGSPAMVSIFSTRGGGRAPRQAKLAGEQIDPKPLGGRGYLVKSASYQDAPPPRTGTVGAVEIELFPPNPGKGKKQPLEPVGTTLLIKAMPGVEYGGVIDKSGIWDIRKKLKSSYFSPVDLVDADFALGDGLTAFGRIPKPSIRLLENVQIGMVVDGDDISLQAEVTGGDLKLPGPFRVTGGVLALSACLNGIAVSGQVDFEIEKLATGYLKGRAGSRDGFSLEGGLDFDSRMFTRAHLGLSYAEGKWGVSGELAVEPDKIKGIKAASAKVAVDDDKVSADGEFEASIKGIKKGQIGFRYDPQNGTEINGMIEFGNLPGIKSGKLDATVTQGREGWTLAGGVTMESSIPGIAATVTGRYSDGAFDANATLAYARGIAKGAVTLGLTNAAVDAEGRPSGPPRPDGALTAYGEGMVTLRLTDWLQGTVGLKLKPNGEIEAAGEVALPSTFEVFPEQRVDRKILSIGIDIPILGISVAGQRIGIFATVRGGVTVGAGIGPGVLKDVSAKVTYNPDHPEATTVKGQGTFHVPASAGLRLNIDGALGAGIPVVSATAGLTVFGEVGLMAAASATAALEWSAAKGVTLDAKGEIAVQPKFRFGIEAFVDVSLDLLVKTIELYHRKWSLASFEYGPSLTFGMLFPIHYESGRPFELSYDQIQWKYPDINPSELLGGLVKQVVG